MHPRRSPTRRSSVNTCVQINHETAFAFTRRRRIYFLAGQYELEEREDADSAKTLMELTADGKALLGSTDGIPFAEAKGRWEYDGKELILELTRTFEDVKSTFSTTRVFIGDVIALNDVPPQVQGAIKMTPSPTSDDMLRIPRHTLPTDAVGYFVAVKIPEIPGAL
jgi:hypothetical protein